MTVTWRTGRSDVRGFHVYRATERDGLYARLTDEPVPAAADSAGHGAYSFLDTTSLLHEVRYWYRVEYLQEDGSSTLKDPVSLPPSRSR